MSLDCMLSSIGDVLGSLGFNIKDSVKKVTDKAKTGAAITPQGQMVQAATSRDTIPTSKTQSGGIVSKLGGSKAGSMLSQLSQRKLYGVPVLFVLAGLGAWGFMRLRKKR